MKLGKKKNVTNQQFMTKPLKQSVVKPKGKGKSLPKLQRGLRTQHFCHHYGIQGHTRPNCHKLQALKNSGAQRSRGPRNDKRNWAVEQSRGRDGDSGVMDVMKMIDAFTTCFHASAEGLKATTLVPNPIGISPQTHVTCG